MPKPLVWCEVRCDRLSSAGCWEGGPKGWVESARDLDALIREAKGVGWKVRDGQTVCPACCDDTGDPNDPR